MPDLAAAESKLERFFRALGEICEGGMSSQLIPFGEGSLRRAMTEYVSHFHGERNHQGKGNILLFPGATSTKRASHGIERNQRLGGYYSRAV